MMAFSSQIIPTSRQSLSNTLMNRTLKLEIIIERFRRSGEMTPANTKKLHETTLVNWSP
jgi:hypothetical protein